MSLLEDPVHAFSLGVQGALAEFMRDEIEAGESLQRGHWRGWVSRRGAIAVDCAAPLEITAWENPGSAAGGWGQHLGLCLQAPAALGAARQGITELGADTLALMPGADSQRLFDLGLGIPHVDVCVGTADKRLIALLRDHAGAALFEADSRLGAQLLRISPRRVFITAVSRIEVATPIPLDHSPAGPHTHLLPGRLGRPDPDACCDGPQQYCMLNIHPAHPCHDLQGREIPFDARRHAGFQALLGRYGDSDYLESKHQAWKLIESAADPGSLPRPFRRAACLALRQGAAAGSLAPDLQQRWQALLEAAEPRAGGS